MTARSSNEVQSLYMNEPNKFSKSPDLIVLFVKVSKKNCTWSFSCHKPKIKPKISKNFHNCSLMLGGSNISQKPVATMSSYLFALLFKVGYQVEAFTLLLQASKHHFGAWDVLLWVFKVLKQRIPCPGNTCKCNIQEHMNGWLQYMY